MRNPECKLCPLHKGTEHVCLWGSGNIQAKLMLIGDAPGREEEMTGKPFMGRAGQLLDYCLMRLKIPRESVYLTNVVKCKPEFKLPTKKKDREALEVCVKTYLMKELNEVDPHVVLLLGATALEFVTGHANISHWQGRKVDDEGIELLPYKVYAGYHPSYILRNRWKERDLVVAIARAAKAAGIPIDVELTGKLFDYDNFGGVS